MVAEAFAGLRVDRLLTLGLFAPLRRIGASAEAPTIPLLMYHSVADDIDRDVHPYFRTVTTPRSFEAQVRCLRERGLQGITLSEAMRLLAAADLGALQRKVVLTFDDGFRDFRTVAWPILQRAGFGATVFMPTAYIGKSFVTGRDCLDAAEIRGLVADGVEFGSHSHSHCRLYTLDELALARELRLSKSVLEDASGQAVTLFSYPYRFPEEDAHFTGRLREQLDRAGYRAGVTTAIGRARVGDDAWLLPRLPVNDCDDAALLGAKLDGHYDWLRTGQRLRKRARAVLGSRAGA
ncbi:polysaccharide deacetylase family protein [Rivibacter subsaxonicus]|uniref:Polysaccharide deacetylase n=1 Tax=Rivibacter subsaxonicus TaxID=457575 RepID=A0A4Q7VWB9_9BURK|nr:polysaccharide deacetylase family protein [Rivibacter subsaxonicus]RZU00785.1 polysaccharide deacetylase [Rivibacter subsaxonicus]